MLTARGLRKTACTLAATTTESRVIARLQDRIDRCEQTRLRQIAPRSMFLKACLDAAAPTYKDHPKEVWAAVRKQIFKAHGAEWRAMDQIDRDHYRKMAWSLTLTKIKAVRDEHQGLEEQLAMQRVRHEEERETTSPWKFDNCRWTEADLQALDVSLRQAKYSDNNVNKRRKGLGDAPDIPDVTVRLTFQHIPEPPTFTYPTPGWLQQIAQQRLHFHRVAIRVAAGAEVAPKFFQFVFARINTGRIGMTVVHRRPMPALGGFFILLGKTI